MLYYTLRDRVGEVWHGWTILPWHISQVTTLLEDSTRWRWLCCGRSATRRWRLEFKVLTNGDGHRRQSLSLMIWLSWHVLRCGALGDKRGVKITRVEQVMNVEAKEQMATSRSHAIVTSEFYLATLRIWLTMVEGPNERRYVDVSSTDASTAPQSSHTHTHTHERR